MGFYEKKKDNFFEIAGLIIPGPLVIPFSGVVGIVKVVNPEERIKYIAN